MSTSSVTIRRAKLVDAPEMARLAEELGYPMPHAEMKRRLERLLPNSRHYIAVAAAAHEQLAGWMHVEHRTSLEGGERGELMGLVVDSTIRRQGIGRQMLDVAENWALAIGLSELTVRSNVARSISHPFYESRSYVRRKTQHVYNKTLTPTYASDRESKKGGCG